MKEKFNKEQHQKFINYLNIKKEHSKIELKFYKKTEKYIKYIKWIPGLKMIWIWNSISMNCASKDSDIDLLIVSSSNTMWLNRILITLIFQILWVRKNEKNHAWRFCLSFFCTIKWLDFSSWKIKNDIYLYFWILYFKPILDYNNTYELFIEKNSSWADFSEYNDIIEYNKKYIKYTNNFLPFPKWVPVGGGIKNNITQKIIWSINFIIKKIFLQKTLKHFKKIWKPYWIIINDNMLKFHNNDIRKKIKETIL